MRIFDTLLGRKLIEDLLGPANAESTWWTDAIFRGLQEGGLDELGAESDRAASTGVVTRELL